MLRRTLLAGLAVALTAPAPAQAAAPNACPGRAIETDHVFTGAFGEDLRQAYVMVPFEVPAGTTAVRVKYCWDQPPASSPVTQQVLDLGIYEPPREPGALWGEREFRGWGGSRVRDATVSPEGFSGDDLWAQEPRREEPGKTSRSFVPGPIPPGRWAVELGVGAVAPAGLKPDGVAWRVEVELSEDPAHADEPYRPAEFDSRPAVPGPGWYAGDMHVHAEHSGGSLLREVFDYAFKPLAAGGGGLDFVTLSEYVTTSHWGEIGRHQARYPGKLVVRSAEVITYRGHLQNHGTASFVDYRTTPVYELRPDGSLVLRRGDRPAAEVFRAIRARGGFTQLNHPTIFPPPVFTNFCRGCAWEYDPAETDYAAVDAIEVANGPQQLKVDPRPGPNPFTVTGLDFFENALAASPGIAPVAGSDAKTGGRVAPPTDAQGDYVTQAPVGEPATVVYAEELSEPGVECAVEAGHTYVKPVGPGAPDLRFEARPAGVPGTVAIMGDTVRAARTELEARVLGGAPDPEPRQLLVLRNGTPVRAALVTGDDFRLAFAETMPGRYRLQLQRGTTIEGVSSPIHLEPGPGEVEARDCRPLRVEGLAERRTRVDAARFPVRCRASGGGLRRCAVRAQARTGRDRRARSGGLRGLRTVGTGTVEMRDGTRTVSVRLTSLGRRLLARSRSGLPVRLVFVASDGEGASATDVARTRLAGPRRPRPGRAPRLAG